VLFIQTNGQDGKIAPLESYPISAKNTAALVISDGAIFGGVIPFSSGTGLSMAGEQDGASWCTTASGTVNAGEYGDPDMLPFAGYSSDSYGNFAPVIVPVDGLKLVAENGNLTGKWQQTWSQYWIDEFTFLTIAI
jgi:hypothetical protein